MNLENKEISNNDLYNLLIETQKQNANLYSELFQEIKEDIKSLKEEISKEVSQLKTENKNLKEENKQLRDRLATTERKLKKYNLIVYGVPGEENETFDKVVDIINTKINVTCSNHNIKDIYRIGQPSIDKPRPVVVELISYRLKTDILANAKKLKGSGIFISHDLTPEDYEKRKLLNKQLKLAREKQLNAKIKKNTLIVNGEVFTYEELKKKNEDDENSTIEILNSSLTAHQIGSTSTKSNSEPTTPRLINDNTSEFIIPAGDQKKRKPEQPLAENKPKRERSSNRKKQ